MEKDKDKSLSHLGIPDKNRGLKHRKNKSKYSRSSVSIVGKLGKDPKYVPQKSNSNLGSNWDRYEKETDSQSFQLSSSTDFSILANTPIAQGHHFQFKQDRIIAEEIDKTPHDLFSLDLNMLKLSILTVPFYERLGISENYFSDSQIAVMNKNAENHLVRYKKKYNSSKMSDINTNNDPCNIEEIDHTKNINKSDVPSSALTKETKVDENVTELTTTIEGLLKPEMGRNVEIPADDLEEWLDDILGE